MQGKMLEQARVREQQLLEDARHNEAVAYAKGLSEGAAILHHKPLSASPTSPGNTYQPGPPPGITAPAPQTLEVTGAAVGVTAVAALATQEPAYGTTYSLPEPVDAVPAYGTVVDAPDVRGTVISNTSLDVPVPVPSDTFVPGSGTQISSAGGTIMPSGSV
jgi:hypothetical protein